MSVIRDQSCCKVESLQHQYHSKPKARLNTLFAFSQDISYYSHRRLVSTTLTFFQPFRALLVPRMLNSSSANRGPHLNKSSSRANNSSKPLPTAPQLDRADSTKMPSRQQKVPAATATPACALETLPVELIHHILDDLPVSSVLLLLSLRKPGSYLHLCVLCHPLYRQIFSSQETLTTARDTFYLLFEVAASIPILPLDLSTFDREHEHGSLIWDCISGCKECLDVLREGLCEFLTQRTLDVVGALGVKPRGNAGGETKVASTMLPPIGRVIRGFRGRK